MPDPSTDTGDVPPWTSWISPLVVIVPVAGLLVSCAFQWSGRAPGETWQQVVYANSLGWLVGAFLCMTAPPHLFFPAPIARSIGWARSRVGSRERAWDSRSRRGWSKRWAVRWVWRASRARGVASG